VIVTTGPKTSSRQNRARGRRGAFSGSRVHGSTEANLAPEGRFGLLGRPITCGMNVISAGPRRGQIALIGELDGDGR